MPWRSPLTCNYRCFTIKAAGKPSTNIIRRKSPEQELCFTGQRELGGARSSAVTPTLNTRGPSLATARGRTPALLTSMDNQLQTILSWCWRLQISCLGTTFVFSRAPGIPHGENALRSCCPLLGEVFCRAFWCQKQHQPTSLITFCWMVEGWVVFGLDTSLRISVPPKALQERHVTAPAVQCPHFPPSGGRGDSVAFVRHFGVGNSHGSAKYHMWTTSYIHETYLRIELLISNDSPRADE